MKRDAGDSLGGAARTQPRLRRHLLISGGANRNYEIVMWDTPRDSYFTLRLTWKPGELTESVAEKIKSQLRKRVVALGLVVAEGGASR